MSSKSYKINNLEQLRLLADPFKLRLLLAFAGTERSAKQVAAELGEPLTKLYRHVDALHAAGLLEIVGEQKKRGAIERTFRAIARQFEVDRGLFAGAAADDTAGPLRQVLRSTEEEVLEALAKAKDDDPSPIVMRMRIKASPERIAALRQQLLRWLEDAEAEGGAADEATDEAGAFIAFYPVDAKDQGRSR
ncbi:MAG TPA: helix-turn-helix domain-containing protein [Woeseiaceae bacterium]|nr:helix-turn-helix domain-containing protein [Woeseiaceae bacterium]